MVDKEAFDLLRRVENILSLHVDPDQPPLEMEVFALLHADVEDALFRHGWDVEADDTRLTAPPQKGA